MLCGAHEHGVEVVHVIIGRHAPYCTCRCCQTVKGGLRDKPGKQPDFYHTCYCLSGLAAAQHASGCVLGPQVSETDRQRGASLARAIATCHGLQPYMYRWV